MSGKQHSFVIFTDIRGKEYLGFLCGSYRQALVDADTSQRIIKSRCAQCGQDVTFDLGWFRWRMLRLPRMVFARKPTPNPMMLLDNGWSGDTQFVPES